MEAQAVNELSNRWRRAAIQAGAVKKSAPAAREQTQPQAVAGQVADPSPGPAVVAVPPMVVVSSRYVLIPVAVAMTGLTRKAIERKIERGIWVEGKHYRRRDGGVYIDMEAYKRWVEEGK